MQAATPRKVPGSLLPAHYSRPGHAPTTRPAISLGRPRRSLVRLHLHLIGTLQAALRTLQLPSSPQTPDHPDADSALGTEVSANRTDDRISKGASGIRQSRIEFGDGQL
jgi:hypothetical protein